MKKKNMLILLVILLTVGFASVSTTLVMNGTIGITYKKSDFNVIFKNASVTGNTAAKATISDNKRTITFETDKLSVVGDTAELVYKVKNDSTQYDANVIVSCTGGNPGYLNIVSEFAGKSLPLTTPELMEAQEVRMGKISVNLTKAYDASVTKTPLTCTLEVEGEERESIVEHSVCEYPDGTEWTFDYTGSEQEFVVPCKGEYKLETWGASGGYAYDESRSTGDGGYGAYAVGNILLNDLDNLFINVGGEGESNCQTTNCKGGYNGGSPSTLWSFDDGSGLWTGGGGGATHIASKKGLLLNLENDKDSVYIVSAGGGGGDYYPAWGHTSTGGSGGGIAGNNGVSGSTADPLNGYNGTQNSGYAFGTAGTTYTTDSCGGSGGGWYGGISAFQHSTGSGGSSYIGNTLLTNKVMYCYNCAESSVDSTKTISNTCVDSRPTENCSKNGNGYAKITLISAK